MDDLLILLDDAAPKKEVEGIKVKNKTKAILCANLCTRDEKGLPESVIWGPLGKDDTRVLSRKQLKSREVRKLLEMKPPKLEIRR